VSEQLYDLHIRIPLSKVSLIIEVLQGEGVLLSVTETKEKKRHQRPHSRWSKATNGSTTGPQSGKELVEQIIDKTGKGGTVLLRELEKTFERRGRNKHSVSPLLSAFTSQGVLKKVETGKYTVLK
jgi:hypothetical protein